MKSSVARAMAKAAFLEVCRREGSALMIFWTRATGGVSLGVEGGKGGLTGEGDLAGDFFGGGDGGVVVGHGGVVPVKGWWGRAWGVVCAWVYLVGPVVG